MTHEPRIPTTDELIELPSPNDPQISPDGAWIAYTLRRPDWKENEYIQQIWLVSASGGSPRQLTFFTKGSSYSPRWSPDGQWLAFLSKRMEDERPQVYRLSPFGGEAERLTEMEARPQAISWSPDGKSIACLAADPESESEKQRKEKFGDFFVEDQDYRRSHLWLLQVDDNKIHKLTSGDEFHVTGFKWAPGSNRIAFEARPTPDEGDWDHSRVYTIEISTLEVKSLTGEGCDAPIWSPDGSQIAHNRAGAPTYYANNAICVISAEGSEPRSLTGGFDENTWIQDWGPEGIYFLSTQRTSLHLFCVDPQDCQVRRLTPENPQGWATFEARFSKDFHRAALIHSDAHHFPEVAVFETGSGEYRLLTNYNENIKDWKLGLYEVFHWTSDDGTPLEGILTRPSDFDPAQKYPLLVVIHGGPAGTSLLQKLSGYERFVYPIQLWAAKGALVLQPNYRGSAGYGAKFRALNVRNLGVGDAMDVISGVHALVERGWVDPLRVGAMGWSQGGYISAFLTTTSDCFKAISVGAGISNWVTYYANTDIHPFTRQYLDATPWEEPEIYEKTSPMTYIKNAKTPTLIQHGEFDRRVPIPNAYELYQGLKDSGVETKLVVYRGMGHGINRPRLNRQVMQENLDWFNRWIWGEALAPGEPTPCYVALWEPEIPHEPEEPVESGPYLAMRKSSGPIADVFHWALRDGAAFRILASPAGLLKPEDPATGEERLPLPEEVSVLAVNVAAQLMSNGFHKLVLYTREVKKQPALLVALGCLQVAAGIAGEDKVEHREITDPGW